MPITYSYLSVNDVTHTGDDLSGEQPRETLRGIERQQSKFARLLMSASSFVARLLSGPNRSFCLRYHKKLQCPSASAKAARRHNDRLISRAVATNRSRCLSRFCIDAKVSVSPLLVKRVFTKHSTADTCSSFIRLVNCSMSPHKNCYCLSRFALAE